MDSAFAKLSRAKWHLESLRAEAEAYRARQPYRLKKTVTDHQIYAGVKVATYRVHVREAPPVSWSVIVGDILSNLRASLDHAIYGHAAVRKALTPEEERSLYYPVVINRDSWRKARKSLKPLVDPAVLGFIEETQPFNHRHDTRLSPLFLLSTLANLDKHRSIRVVSFSSGPVDFESEAEIISTYAPAREWTEGAVVASVQVRVPPGQPDLPGRLPSPLVQKIGHGPTIALPPGVGDPYWPVVDTMDICATTVELVLNDLKAAGC